MREECMKNAARQCDAVLPTSMSIKPDGISYRSTNQVALCNSFCKCSKIVSDDAIRMPSECHRNNARFLFIRPYAPYLHFFTSHAKPMTSPAFVHAATLSIRPRAPLPARASRNPQNFTNVLPARCMLRHSGHARHGARAIDATQDAHMSALCAVVCAAYDTVRSRIFQCLASPRPRAPC
eukprot:IDg10711t1